MSTTLTFIHIYKIYLCNYAWRFGRKKKKRERKRNFLHIVRALIITFNNPLCTFTIVKTGVSPQKLLTHLSKNSKKCNKKVFYSRPSIDRKRFPVKINYNSLKSPVPGILLFAYAAFYSFV